MSPELPRVKRWVHTRNYVVEVEVDAIIPPDDPSEPCFEPQTVQFLKEVHERAEAGDLEWLKHAGKVFVAVPA